MPRPDTGTREKLVETAIELVWKSSYGAVSVDDICKAAGVKKGSFYHYFPSKTDLAIAAMEAHFQDVKADLEAIFHPGLPVEEKFERLSDIIITRQRDMQARAGMVCGCPFAALGSEMAGEEHQAIRVMAEEKFEFCRRYMLEALQQAVEEDLLPEDTDIDARAEEIHTFITGQMMMARIHNSLAVLERDLKPGLFRLLGLEEKEILERPSTIDQKTYKEKFAPVVKSGSP